LRVQSFVQKESLDIRRKMTRKKEILIVKKEESQSKWKKRKAELCILKKGFSVLGFKVSKYVFQGIPCQKGGGGSSGEERVGEGIS